MPADWTTWPQRKVPVSCPVCGKVFVSKRYLNQHITKMVYSNDAEVSLAHAGVHYEGDV